MHHISLIDIEQTEQEVTAEHFGGNVIFSRNTNNGSPGAENQIAHQELDITVTRYPAGEPDVAYRDGLLIDGALPDHLVNYMNAAQESGQKVVIVTPTHEAYTGPDDFSGFAALLMQRYGNVVHAFEIGNEYWGHQTETSYGEVANDSVIALAEGLASMQVDVPIWVQMGDASGASSEYYNREDVGWLWRNIEANNLIIDQLSNEARSEIDGLVEHYYFREQGQFLEENLNDQNIRLDLGVWEEALARDLTLNITEWNIRTTNFDQLGMKAASTLIAQFSFMMELNIDEAYVWPPMHNTSSDLAGGDVVILDGETGIVINSVGGATFDLMSSALVGLEYLSSITDETSELINQYVFADDETVVVYLTSRSINTEMISFNLDQIWGGAALLSATQVGYDQSSSDGLHYDYEINRFVNSESVMVDGETYFTNEHDVQASIDVHDVSGTAAGERYDITLQPYEVIELIYEIPTRINITSDSIVTPEGIRLAGLAPSEPSHQGLPTIDSINTQNAVMGSYDDDQINTYGANNVVFGGGGDDQISSGAGNDSVAGNGGSDEINAGNGFDLILGGSGFDTINGGNGFDTIDGGNFADSLSGGRGNDVIMGGNGWNQIYGGQGSDYIWGGAAADRIYGGNQGDWIDAGSSSGSSVDRVWGEAGDDTIFGNAGFDFLDGGAGNDLISGGNQADNLFGRGGADMLLGGNGLDRMFGGNGNDQISGGLGNDRQFGESGEDTLWGGEGGDRLFGGQGNDILDGGRHDDTIYGGAGFDTLIGGLGDDILFGNLNSDVFVFLETHGNDTIVDFDANNNFEQIDFSSLNFFENFETILSHSMQIEEDVVITTGSDSSVTLLGVDISLLDSNDFL